jgi:hypothetical protein
VARLERLSLDKHAIDGLLAGLNQRDDLRVGHCEKRARQKRSRSKNRDVHSQTFKPKEHFKVLG